MQRPTIRALFPPILLVLIALAFGYPMMRWGTTGSAHRWVNKRFGWHRELPDKCFAIFPDQQPLSYEEFKKDGPATLYCYFADEKIATGTSLLVCVGGGYAGLSMNQEGQECVQYLRRLGIHVFLLRYKVTMISPNDAERRIQYPNGTYPQPIKEVFRAMRYLRANASELGIDPHRIGLAGFSAGGHLASTLGTHYDAGNPAAADPVDRMSCRPDFLVLVYPVITMKLRTKSDSRGNLLGDNPAPELIEMLSNENHVKSDMPATFLVHAKKDSMVSLEHSIRFDRELERKQVPHQFVILEHGDHGVPMRFYISELTDWLEQSKWILPQSKKGRNEKSGPESADNRR